MIEFAEQLPERGLLGLKIADAGAGQPIQYAKLLLAKAFVEANRLVQRGTASASKDIGSLAGAEVRRGQDDLRPVFLRLLCEPVSQRRCLLPPEAAEWHVGIADGERDAILLRLMCSVACDIPGTLPMTDDDQLGWPPAGSTQGTLLEKRHFSGSARRPR